MECENVMDFYIQTIFTSGMLLNEHDELLTEFWRPTPQKPPKYAKIYLISACSVAGLALGVYRKSTFLGLTSTIPLGLEICYTIHEKYKCKQYKEQFSLLVNALRDIYVLIKKILQQYHLQKANVDNLSSCTRDVIKDLILDRMLQFLIRTGQIVFDMVLVLKDILKEIGNIIDLGDLNLIFGFDVYEMARFDNDSEEFVLNNYNKIHMAFIYVASTFLCAFGLSLCKQERRSANPGFPKLFSLLSKCLVDVVGVSKRLKEDFESTCNTLNKDSIKIINKRNEIPMKDTLANLIAQIQACFDITIAMQHRVLFYKSDSNIGNYLDDLESTFVRLNDIVIVLRHNLQRAPRAEMSVLKLREGRRDEKEQNHVTLINGDDDDEESLKDEEYNLSIHEISGSSSSDDEEDASNLEYEELLGCVKAQKAMIRELNEELRRRNIVRQAAPVTPRRPPPLALDNRPVVPRNDLPVPSANVDTRNISNQEFLAKIRASATSMGIKETIFADDIYWSEDSSDEE